jgi:hypothetical protein
MACLCVRRREQARAACARAQHWTQHGDSPVQLRHTRVRAVPCTCARVLAAASLLRGAHHETMPTSLSLSGAASSGPSLAAVLNTMGPPLSPWHESTNGTPPEAGASTFPALQRAARERGRERRGARRVRHILAARRTVRRGAGGAAVSTLSPLSTAWPQRRARPPHDPELAHQIMVALSSA